jgi:hypothetical protein
MNIPQEAGGTKKPRWRKQLTASGLQLEERMGIEPMYEVLQTPA